jgi:hypothetical protein
LIAGAASKTYTSAPGARWNVNQLSKRGEALDASRPVVWAICNASVFTAIRNACVIRTNPPGAESSICESCFNAFPAFCCNDDVEQIELLHCS